MVENLAWIGFIGFILLMLALDLGIFNRTPHTPSMKEAAAWSAVWIGLALLFGKLVWLWKGPTAGLEYFTGYLIEKSLSVDNIFVFVMIFSYFSVPSHYQHRVLFWGILGALLMRALFILLGVKLMESFHFIFYIFGLFLVYTAYKMYKERHHHRIKVSENPLIDWVTSVLPMTKEYVGGHFFVKQQEKWHATPLFLVLLTIEFTDLVFAIDSIPAILAISRDSFIVFTSNIFAILGLRALYFLLADLVPRFYYLKHALSLILGFVGLKMLLLDLFKIPVAFSLSFILVVLTGSIVLSFFKRNNNL